MSGKEHSNYAPREAHTKVHRVPQHHNEVISDLLSQQPSRTLHGNHPDIIVYEVSGWNIYVITGSDRQQTKLFIDTSHPKQHSEMLLYKAGQYQGKTYMKLHGEYDQSAQDFFADKLSVNFTPPDKTPE